MSDILTDDQIKSLRGRILSVDEATSVLDCCVALKTRTSHVIRTSREACDTLFERLETASGTLEEIRRENRRLKDRIASLEATRADALRL